MPAPRRSRANTALFGTPQSGPRAAIVLRSHAPVLPGHADQIPRRLVDEEPRAIDMLRVRAPLVVFNDPDCRIRGARSKLHLVFGSASTMPEGPCSTVGTEALWISWP